LCPQKARSIPAVAATFGVFSQRFAYCPVIKKKNFCTMRKLLQKKNKKKRRKKNCLARATRAIQCRAFKARQKAIESHWPVSTDRLA